MVSVVDSYCQHEPKKTLIKTFHVPFLDSFFLRIALVRGSFCGRDVYSTFFGIFMPPLGLASLAGTVRANRNTSSR
jgi:hypothetical protein